MSTDAKVGIILILCATCVALTTIGYNLYTNAQNRELYRECLRVNEVRFKEGNRADAVWCRL